MTGPRKSRFNPRASRSRGGRLTTRPGGGVGWGGGGGGEGTNTYPKSKGWSSRVAPPSSRPLTGTSQGERRADRPISGPRAARSGCWPAQWRPSAGGSPSAPCPVPGREPLRGGPRQRGAGPARWNMPCVNRLAWESWGGRGELLHELTRAKRNIKLASSFFFFFFFFLSEDILCNHDHRIFSLIAVATERATTISKSWLKLDQFTSE